MRPSDHTSRRAVLAGAAAGLTALALPAAHAEEADMLAAIRSFTGGATPQPGRVRIDVEPLVENGNSVSVGVSVASPMTEADHVTALALFNEKNPLPEVAVFHLSPRSGVARVDTRIRVATTQHLMAVARLSDGSFWSDRREVIVTIAACTED